MTILEVRLNTLARGLGKERGANLREEEYPAGEDGRKEPGVRQERVLCLRGGVVVIPSIQVSSP